MSQNIRGAIFSLKVPIKFDIILIFELLVELHITRLLWLCNIEVFSPKCILERAECFEKYVF